MNRLGETGRRNGLVGSVLGAVKRGAADPPMVNVVSSPNRSPADRRAGRGTGGTREIAISLDRTLMRSEFASLN